MFTVGLTLIEPEVAPEVENPIPEQLVAFADVHESVELSPEAILSGVAVSSAKILEVIGTTVTVLLENAEPPGPVQVRVNVFVVVRAPVDSWGNELAVGRDPVHDPLAGVALAVHAVVFVEVQESVDAFPEKRLAGEALRVTDGVPGGVAKQIDPFQEEPPAQVASAVS